MQWSVFNLKRSFAASWKSVLLVLGGAAVLSGCVVAPVHGHDSGYAYSSTTIYTSYGHPPPPRREYRRAAPSPHHVWVAGNWFWTGGRYDWRPGHWRAPSYRMLPPPRPVVIPVRPQHMRPPPPPRPHYRPDQRPRPPHTGPQSHRPGPAHVRPHNQRPDQGRPQRPHRGDGHRP